MEAQQAWNDNLISLNQVRLALGLPKDSRYGHRYKFELFPQAAHGQKDDEAAFDVHQEALSEIQDQALNPFAKAYAGLLKELKRWIVDVTYSEGKSADFAAKIPKMAQEMEHRLSVAEKKLSLLYRKELEEVVLSSGKTSAALVNGTFTKKQAKEELRQLGSDFARRMTQGYKRELRAVFETATRERWTLTKFRDELRAQFNQFVKRSDLVSAAEVTRASGRASVAAYKVNGVKYLKWHAERDACGFCRSMHGRTVSIGNPFYQVGETIEAREEGRVRRMVVKYEDIAHQPAHPRCRCSVVPAWGNLLRMASGNDDGEIRLPSFNQHRAGDPSSSFRQAVAQRIEQGVETEKNVIEVGKRIQAEIKQRTAHLRELEEETIDSFVDWFHKRKAFVKGEGTREEYDRAEKHYIDRLSKLREEKVPIRLKVLGEVREIGLRPHIQPSLHPSTDPIFREAFQDVTQYLPSDWLHDLSHHPLEIVWSENHRSYFTPGTNRIAINSELKEDNQGDRLRQILTHELMHWFEENRVRLRIAEAEFYRRRTAGEPLKEMGDGDGVAYYRKDDFPHWYIGRIYGENPRVPGMGEGYEILTTGSEYLFGNYMENNMVFFLDPDEDFDAFLLGVWASL